MTWTEPDELCSRVQEQFIDKRIGGLITFGDRPVSAEAVREQLELCLREVEAVELIRVLASWLHNRCVWLARELRVEPDRVYGAVVGRFERRVCLGFLDNEKSLNLLARSKYLFQLCLRHEKDAIIKEQNLLTTFDETRPQGEGVEAVEQPGVERVDWSGRFHRVMDLLLQVCSPPNALSLLSRDLPWHVSLELVGGAKDYNKGGSTMVMRTAEESLGLLKDSIDLYRRARTYRAWTLVLAAIYFSRLPFDDIQLGSMEKKAKNIERYARRALQDLQVHFAAPQRTTP